MKRVNQSGNSSQVKQNKSTENETPVVSQEFKPNSRNGEDFDTDPVTYREMLSLSPTKQLGDIKDLNACIQEREAEAKRVTKFICGWYFEGLQSKVDEYAKILSILVKGSSGFENLQKKLSWSNRFAAIVDRLSKVFKFADAAWGKDLNDKWSDKHSFVIKINHPPVFTENCEANTFLIRFIRLMRLAIDPTDNTFLTDPNDPCFDPAEVKKGVFENIQEARKLDASDFDSSKFINKGNTQFKELNKHYELMIYLITNYAKQHLHDRKKVHSPDFIFLWLVITRLNNVIKNVETNESKRLLLEELGLLIAFVKLAKRIQLFNVSNWPWNIETPLNIKMEKNQMPDAYGTLTMQQVILQLDESLERIREEVQTVVDDRSIYAHGGRLITDGGHLLKAGNQFFRALAGSEETVDPKTLRNLLKEAAIFVPENGNSNTKPELVEINKNVKKSNPSTALQVPKHYSPKGSSLILISGIKSYREEVLELMNFEPTTFQENNQKFLKFQNDLHSLLKGLLPPLQQKHPKNLEGIAKDYASIITIINILSARLSFAGQTLQNLSHFSGDLELYHKFKKVMLDTCAGIRAFLQIAQPILQRLINTCDLVASKEDHLLVTDLQSIPAYQNLFSGSGHDDLTRVQGILEIIRTDIEAFYAGVDSFGPDKFTLEIAKQIRDGHYLANMGYYLGQDLLFVAKISSTEPSTLRFPFQDHKMLLALTPDDPFNAQKLGLLQEVLVQDERVKALNGNASGNAIVGPSYPQNSAELIKLREENIKLKQEILAFGQPRLKVGFFKENAARIGKSAALDDAIAQNNEVAKLQAEVQVLTYALERAYKQLSDYRNDLSGQATPQAYLAKFKLDCEKIKDNLFDKELKVIYGQLQEALTAAQGDKRKAEVVSSSAPYLIWANEIFSQVTDKEDFALLKMIKEKVVLDKAGIENRLKGPAKVQSAKEQGKGWLNDNNNNELPPAAVEKELPSEMILRVIESLLKVKGLFTEITQRIPFTYMTLSTPPQKGSAGLFGLGKSKSPSIMEKYISENCAARGPLSCDFLYDLFLQKFFAGEWNTENIKSAVKSVVLENVFVKIFVDCIANSKESFLAHACAGLLAEMSYLVRDTENSNLEDKFLSPEKKESYDLKTLFGNDVFAYIAKSEFGDIRSQIEFIMSSNSGYSK